MAGALQRVVVVTRRTELELLTARHGTREQARFYATAQGRSFDELVERAGRQHDAVSGVLRAIPNAWRRARIDREDLPSFAFEPEDVVVPVGQDGLVANVAKYLEHQAVVGINPDRSEYEGVLVRHDARDAAELLRIAARGDAASEERTMVEVRFDDGQTLRALNEIFVGHRSHQSARYRIRVEGVEERQISSGLIVATGTGATGWARSIARERRDALELPAPTAPSLALFVREAFPAPAAGTALTAARLAAPITVEVVSEMGEGGVVFGDGLEDDRLDFGWGRLATVGTARTGLRLVV
jgi:NAD kinase